MVFSKLIFGMVFVASASAAPTCFDCSALSSLITCSVTAGEDTATNLYTFNLTGVKDGDTLSWACTRGIDVATANVACGEGFKEQNKCEEVVQMTANIPKSQSQVTLQIHDGRICGDVPAGQNSNDATGLDPLSTCGGIPSACSGCTSGVCNVPIDLTKCDSNDLPVCEQATCDALNDPSTCTKFVCGQAGQCEAVPREAGYVCRGAADVCDVQETCDGSSQSCPVDAFLSGAVCRPKTFGADGTSCDVQEVCDGTRASCPEDRYEQLGAVCREPVTATDSTTCDAAEVCTGTSKSCPSDAVLPAGTLCRSKADKCDVSEACTGSSITCPADLRKDHAYTFKCATTIYLCGVPATTIDGLDGLTLGSGGQSFFGSCGIGRARSIVTLDWPECASQCVNSLCQNDRALSNYAYGSCVPASGSWYCEGKVDVAGPTGCYSLPWQV